jgi:hypothetical protein
MSLYEEAIADAKKIREIAKNAALNDLKEHYSKEYKESFFNKINEVIKMNEAGGLGKDPMAAEDDAIPDVGNPDGTEGEPEDPMAMDGATPSSGGELDSMEGLGDDSAASMSMGDSETDPLVKSVPPAFGEQPDDQVVELDLDDMLQGINKEVEASLGDSFIDRESMGAEMGDDEMMHDESPGDNNDFESFSDDEDEYEINKESIERILQLEEKLNSRIYELQDENKDLIKTIRALQNESNILKNQLNKTNTRLEEATHRNTKLVYKNRTLTDVSLNERQKERILSAIDNVTKDDTEIIPKIYNSLKESVSAPLQKRKIESLSELTQKNGQTFGKFSESRKINESKDDAFIKMQKLAGLIKD